MSTITADRTVELMVRSGALMRGHFRLTSGLHSDEYCQCAKVLEHPEMAAELGGMLADLYRNAQVDVVVSPAIGGIVIGHEVARALGVRSLFAERGESGMSFRRGFRIAPGDRVLIIEDVVTTGGSVKEVAEAVAAAGGKTVGFGFIMDRSRQPLDLPGSTKALLEGRQLEVYEPDNCPLCEAGVPIEKPGSRPE
ncbi:MAG: orotate phosphoribosyltransferase [Candidatus Eisenbacteria bacterium]